MLNALGRPDRLYRVAVVPLWGDHFRVNVVTGDDPSAVRIPHSYFVAADGLREHPPIRPGPPPGVPARPLSVLPRRRDCPTLDSPGTDWPAPASAGGASFSQEVPKRHRDGAVRHQVRLARGRGISAEAKTLDVRQKELQALLSTPSGRAELERLAARYAAASGRLRSTRTP